MSGMWARGRAADRFDAAVDGTVDGAHGSGAEGVAPADLLALVGALRALPEVAPRPEQAAALRERLMVEADRLADLRAAERPDPSAASTPVGADGDEDRLRLHAPRRHPRRLAVLAGTVAALGASTTVGVAAQSALPGESLYPVKRALEDARSQVARSETTHGELLLGNASDRLGEATALLTGDDRADLDEVAPTLDGFSAQAADGAGRLLAEYDRTGDRTLVQELRDFTASSRGELDDMAIELPQSARGAWSRAVAAVEDIDADAFAACPLCVAAPADLATRGEQLSAADDLPGLPVVPPGTEPADPRGGDRSERRGSGGDDRRGDGRRGSGASLREPGRGGDGDGGGGGGDDGGLGPVDPGPRLPGSPSDGGGGLGGLLGDGVTSGLGDGGGLGKGLRDLGDGLGEGLGGALRGDGSKDDRAKKDGRRSGSGDSGGPGSGLDDLLP